MRNWLLIYVYGVPHPFVISGGPGAEAGLTRILEDNNTSAVTVRAVGRYIDLPFPHFVPKEGNVYRYIANYEESLEESWD